MTKYVSLISFSLVFSGCFNGDYKFVKMNGDSSSFSADVSLPWGGGVGAPPATPVLSISTISPASGLSTGGYLLTIDGTAFSASTTVTVGGSVCWVSTWSSTRLTCNATAGSVGVQDVMVMDGVFSAALYGAFTYTVAAPFGLAYPNFYYVFPKGVPISSLIPSNGGGAIASYSAAPALPSGLNINSMSGYITGTPISLFAESNFTITGTNASGSTNTTLTIGVKDLKWGWMKGATSPAASGTYGTIGTPSASNTPGARTGFMIWKTSTSIWVMGGHAYDSMGSLGLLNDLFRYDFSTGNWTWMKGSNLVSTASATYGTRGTPSTPNVPGPRTDGATWVDSSGNLWLFGGSGKDASAVVGRLNDLWKFDVGTSQWTWISGNSGANQNGLAGLLGVFDTTYDPGPREKAMSWKDGSGNFYLFGGYGQDQGGSTGHLNDLWKYDTGSSKWGWVGGDSTRDSTGSFGSMNVTVSANKPSARWSGSAWVSGSMVYLFGGFGLDSGGGSGKLNDFWRFDGTNWTWIGGSSLQGQAGSYGAIHFPQSANMPGAREDFATWVDAGGKLWMFGGDGYDSTGSMGSLNDLWKFDPSLGKWTWVSGSNLINDSQVFGAAGGMDPSFHPKALKGMRGVFHPSGNQFWIFGGGDVSNKWNALWQFVY